MSMVVAFFYSKNINRNTDKIFLRKEFPVDQAFLQNFCFLALIYFHGVNKNLFSKDFFFFHGYCHNIYQKLQQLRDLQVFEI